MKCFFKKDDFVSNVIKLRIKKIVYGPLPFRTFCSTCYCIRGSRNLNKYRFCTRFLLMT